MLAVVALNNRQYSYLQLLSLWGLSDQSLRMYAHAWGKSPRMPRTPMFSGEWRKTISTTDRALSPQTHIIICTSFISSMVCTVFYCIAVSHKWPSVPKRDVKQYFTGNYTINKQWNSRNTCTLCLHHLICSVLLSSQKTCVYVFSPPSPEIKRNLIYYAPGVPPNPISGKGEKHICNKSDT